MLVEEQLAGNEGIGGPRKDGLCCRSQVGHEVGPEVVDYAPCKYVVEMRVRDCGRSNTAEGTHLVVA